MDQFEYTIEELRRHNSLEQMVITRHGLRRLNERGLTVEDVIEAIDNGEMIEQYLEDDPFPSCLILGSSKKLQYIHAVVALDGERIYWITAYVPNDRMWQPDRKTRRNGHEMYQMRE